MFKLNSEQLHIHLRKGLSKVYLLIGNDPFLLQESRRAICCIAEKQGFNGKPHTLQVRNNTDWEKFFSLCKEMNIFSEQQILHIEFFRCSYSVNINKKISTLITLLHDDLILILQENQSSKKQPDPFWLSQLPSYTVVVSCYTPEKRDLLIWIATRAKRDRLQLEKAACNLLCSHYEGNLLALSQILNQLLTLWPDRKLTFSRVERAINDEARFLPSHWINSLLEANIGRALRILRHLRLEDVELTVLLRLFQRKLLLLLVLKQKSTHVPIHTLLNRYRVQETHRTVIIQALLRLNKDQLGKALQLLTSAELLLKQNYKKLAWTKLESLSLFLCQESLGKNLF